MMAARLNKSQLYALCLAGLAAVGVAFVGWNLTIAPILTKQREIHDLNARIVSLSQSRDRLGDAERWLEAGREVDSLRALFIDAPTEATATAELQTILRQSAQQTGVELSRVRPASLTAGALPLIGVQISFRGTLNEVSEFLALLESNEPVLLVKNIELGVGAGDEAREAVLNANAVIAAPAWRDGVS